MPRSLNSINIKPPSAIGLCICFPNNTNSVILRITLLLMAPKKDTRPPTIIVEKRSGEKLVGLLHETGSPEVVVLCHGFGSSKASPTIVKLAKALEKGKITAFRFDFSGNGESDGTFQYSNYWIEVEDLRAVVEYFTERNRKIAAILGHSKGANVVLLYASKYHDVPKIVNLAARFNLDEGIESRLGRDFLERITRDGHIDVANDAGEVEYRVTKQSVEERLSINMGQSCLVIDKNCRVLTVHGYADEITPVADAFQFDGRIANHKVHIIEAANHCFKGHKDELTSVVLSFIRDDLQQGP